MSAGLELAHAVGARRICFASLLLLRGKEKLELRDTEFEKKTHARTVAKPGYGVHLDHHLSTPHTSLFIPYPALLVLGRRCRGVGHL